MQAEVAGGEMQKSSGQSGGLRNILLLAVGIYLAGAVCLSFLRVRKRELAVLGELQWGVFKPSSNKQLIPIREVAYFRASAAPKPATADLAK